MCYCDDITGNISRYKDLYFALLLKKSYLKSFCYNNISLYVIISANLLISFYIKCVNSVCLTDFLLRNLNVCTKVQKVDMWKNMLIMGNNEKTLHIRRRNKVNNNLVCGSKKNYLTLNKKVNIYSSITLSFSSSLAVFIILFIVTQMSSSSSQCQNESCHSGKKQRKQQTGRLLCEVDANTTK